MYRPKCWKNPHPDINKRHPTNDWAYSQYDLAREYEAGADAMLEGLKKQGRRYGEGATPYTGEWRKAGYLVFIPEE